MIFASLFSISGLVLILFCGGLFAGVAAAEGAIYKYFDRNGTLQVTDSFESIPPEYRKQIQTVPERRRPPASVKEDEGSKSAEPARKTLEESQKRKEADVQSAKEKEVTEKKAREREEKEERIGDLQKQIAALEEQRKNLRPPWMPFPYNRTEVYRLDSEIKALELEVQAIQMEIEREQ
jgi:hypothetical protein